jgi:hypothetical protein
VPRRLRAWSRRCRPSCPCPPASASRRSIHVKRACCVSRSIGTVHSGPCNASGDWGTLTTEKGVLIASDGRSRRVSAPVRRDT